MTTKDTELDSLTKEVQMMFKDGTSRTSTLNAQKDTCFKKNCMARGRVYVVPILSVHNPFYLCNKHWKEFKKTILHHARSVRKDSREYDLLWVSKDAIVVDKVQLEELRAKAKILQALEE